MIYKGWTGLMIMLAILFLPNLSLSGTVDLPRTGQTECYDYTGTQIACAGTGHDGDIQAGIAWPVPRFKNNGDGTVTDKLTGLMWLKDANCMSTNYPTFDQDWVAEDGGVYWPNALVFVTGINAGTYANCSAGYTDWRLPNINELETLVNAGLPNSAIWLNAQGFNNVQEDFYWSSTTYAYSTDNAFVIRYRSNEITGYSKTGDYTNTFYVFPVRGDTAPPAQVWKTGQTASYMAGDDGALQKGVAWPNPRFTDHGDGTVTDNLTGLMWLKDANCILINMAVWSWGYTWVAEINANPGNYMGCEEYTGSYTDWRIPNRKELLSLIDYSQTIPALQTGHPFLKVQSWYWSSTTSWKYGTANTAWMVSEHFGTVFDSYKWTGAFFWPVRSGKTRAKPCVPCWLLLF